MRKYAVLLFSILLLGVTISLELESFELSSPITSVTSLVSSSEVELIKPTSTKKVLGATDNPEGLLCFNGFFHLALSENKNSPLVRGAECFSLHFLFPHMYQSNYLHSLPNLTFYRDRFISYTQFPILN